MFTVCTRTPALQQYLLCEEMPKSAIKGVFASAEHHLALGAQAKAEGVDVWWKSSEAALLAIGKVSNDYVESNITMDLSGFMRKVFVEHLQSDGVCVCGWVGLEVLPRGARCGLALRARACACACMWVRVCLCVRTRACAYVTW